ncbi:hypothetical protein HanIR_Chr02g0093171 [Helianthus annuus]|nr:hypothetical protein HanIR_Chr02g0093171 [Helianthus annuus]
MYIYQGAKLIWIQKVKRCIKELKNSSKQNRKKNVWCLLVGHWCLELFDRKPDVRHVYQITLGKRKLPLKTAMCVPKPIKI